MAVTALELDSTDRGPEAVAVNQRTRIFGATVAVIAETGYGATRIADVADWAQRLRAIYGRFAEMVAAQPATASLVLIDAYAAAPSAALVLDQATASFERLSRRLLRESPERAGLPATMIQAQIGALQELARTRLRRGEAGTLPTLVPDLVDLIAGYRPPSERLRSATRRSPSEPEVTTSPEGAEPAIHGFLLAVAEHGYAGATIQEIARHSGMSPNTFYANFHDKREALLAAIDASTGQLSALAMAAYRRIPVGPAECGP